MTPADIKALRSRLGWSQDRLGREIGVTGRFIRMLEAGDKPVSRTVECALLHVVGSRQ